MTRIRRSAVALLCSLGTLAPLARAQEPQTPPRGGDPHAADHPADPPRRAALRRRMDLVLELLAGRGSPDHLPFSDAFVARTPRDRALAELADRAAEIGPFDVLERRPLGPREAGAWLRSTADRTRLWTLRLSIEAQPPHRIDALTIERAGPPGADADAWNDFEAWLEPLPFVTAFALAEAAPDGALTLRRLRRADLRMGIGTLGTTWAHAALADLVHAGGMTWERTLLTDESLRCPPAASRFASQPGGVEAPIALYARQALLDNDNTAAEHLCAMLGRERIEASRDAARADAVRLGGPADLPAGEPFLTPLEMYRLKCGVTDLINRYAAADTPARRAILADEVPHAEIHPTFLQIWNQPQEPVRAGWAATARELVALAARLHALERAGDPWALGALRPPAPPGPDHRARPMAARVAGEPGALAGLWVRTRADGSALILALIMNRDLKPIPEDESAEVIARAIDRLGLTP